MSRRTKKPKREFSKLILYVVGAVTVGVTAFTLIMVWKTENLEPLAYLIPAIFAELATATGFYYSKAKAENRIKLRKLYGPEIYNDAKYSLQGTTQGNGLTGADMPVRFSM